MSLSAGELMSMSGLIERRSQLQVVASGLSLPKEWENMPVGLPAASTPATMASSVELSAVKCK